MGVLEFLNDLCQEFLFKANPKKKSGGYCGRVQQQHFQLDDFSKAIVFGYIYDGSACVTFCQMRKIKVQKNIDEAMYHFY
jgi:hypothetical protein